MKLNFTIFITIFAFQLLAAQSRDSVLFTIAKIDSNELHSTYRLRAWNTAAKPYCIYHSAYIVPGQIPSPILPVMSRAVSVEYFNLNYSLKDAERDHFYEGDYLSGFIVLPYQHVDFYFTTPNSVMRKILKVKFSRIVNFCHDDFVSRMLANAATWHTSLLKEEMLLEMTGQ